MTMMGRGETENTLQLGFPCSYLFCIFPATRVVYVGEMPQS